MYDDFYCRILCHREISIPQSLLQYTNFCLQCMTQHIPISAYSLQQQCRTGVSCSQPAGQGKIVPALRYWRMSFSFLTLLDKDQKAMATCSKDRTVPLPGMYIPDDKGCWYAGHWAHLLGPYSSLPSAVSFCSFLKRLIIHAFNIEQRVHNFSWVGSELSYFYYYYTKTMQKSLCSS